MEGDLTIPDSQQALVGDGHPVRVAAEVFQYLRGTAPGRLGVDDPLLLAQRGQKGGEVVWLLERFQFAEEPQLAVGGCLLERLQKQRLEALGS